MRSSSQVEGPATPLTIRDLAQLRDLRRRARILRNLPIVLDLPGISPEKAICSSRRTIAYRTCNSWADKGSNQCTQWADQGSNQCAQWADEGSNQCAQWADEGSNQCCDWWPCSWFCDAFYWIAKWVCTAFYWVAKWVCLAWFGSLVGFACYLYGSSFSSIGGNAGNCLSLPMEFFPQQLLSMFMRRGEANEFHGLDRGSRQFQSETMIGACRMS